MLNWTQQSDLASSLRSIVLHSGDASPEQVAGFMEKVGQRGDFQLKQQVFQAHAPLAGALPEQYADYALDYLLHRPKNPRPPGPRPVYDPSLNLDRNELGIRDCLAFFSPSHLKGPFLFLLRRHEEAGLRLIQGLANAAVKRWRWVVQQPGRYQQPRVPLPIPIPIELASGTREFWGDEAVYYWFRPQSTAPYPVAAALMALEFWVEEQIEAGRDAAELLHKVLEGSDCVAVAGLCLGVMMARLFPQASEGDLRLALPFLRSPHIWHLEIRRYARDQTSGATQGGAFDNSFWHSQQMKRDERPQRAINLHRVAVLYTHSEDESLRLPFAQAIEQFPQNLPFLYEDERDDPEVCRELEAVAEKRALMAQRENLYLQDVGGQVLVALRIPEHIRQREEPEDRKMESFIARMKLSMWVTQTLEQEQFASGMAPEQALQAAHDLLEHATHASEDDTLSFLGLDVTKLSAAISVAVAVAVLAVDFAWAQTNGHLDWCRSICMKAAGAQLIGSKAQESPARGLGVLVAHGAADEDARVLLLLLSALPSEPVVEGVFLGLRDAWEVDPVLCWNALSLCLLVALEPRGTGLRIIPADGSGEPAEHAKRLQRAEQLYLAQLEIFKRGELPPLPEADFHKVGLRQSEVAQALSLLPLQVLTEGEEDKARLLHITDQLFRWTIARNTPREDDPHGFNIHVPYEWNDFLMGWLARLSVHLSPEECQAAILRPVQEAWEVAPQLTTGLLEGYVRWHLKGDEPPRSEVMAQWKQLCLGILEFKQNGRRRRRARDDRAALALVILNGQAFARLPDEWPHAALFTDVIEKWIELVGGDPYLYPDLLAFLAHPGWRFCPSPALEWLARCAGAYRASVGDVEGFYNETTFQTGGSYSNNAQKTASLLNRMWAQHEAAIRANAPALQQFTRLVEALIPFGVPLAAQLQARLEAL